MSTTRTLLVLGVGLGTGWAARSLVDSPHDAGVKLMTLAMRARGRVGRWAAFEREHLTDMLAEARSRREDE